MPNLIATYGSRTNPYLRIYVSRTGDAQNGQFTYVGNSVLDSGISKITLTNPDGLTSTLVQLHEGSLDYTAKRVPKRELTAFCFADTMLDTLAIKTMKAEPQGQGLGNILVYHLAVLAGTQGVEYVVALNVVPRANMFYQRLGFRAYRSNAAVLEARGWAQGQDQQAWYNTYNQAQGTAFGLATTDTARNQILGNLQAVRGVLAENHMIVSTATLRANALAAWQRHWAAI